MSAADFDEVAADDLLEITQGDPSDPEPKVPPLQDECALVSYPEPEWPSADDDADDDTTDDDDGGDDDSTDDESGDDSAASDDDDDDGCGC